MTVAALLAQGLGHHRAGRLAEAEGLYRQVLETAPEHGEALNLLGVARAQQGALAEGRALLQRAVAAEPERAEVHANLGQIELMAGERAAAERCYRQALTLAPDHQAARLNLGNLLLAGDRMEEAAACFEQLAAQTPALAEAHEGLGFARQRQQRPAEARAAFEAALARRPAGQAARAPLLANLGGLLLDGGDAAGAVDRLKEAVALAPDQAELRANLGIALYAYGDLEGALTALDGALAQAPAHTRALGAKGVLLAELGRSEEAAQIVDYDALLYVQPVTPPPNGGSLEAFNRALATQVLAAPSLMAERAGKTTRGGSQSGELFRRPDGALAHLVAEIERAMGAYFATGDGHPHRPRRPHRARLTGWATVLESGGHQDPHNHPGGVLSGVYYVRLPATADEVEGNLEFGRPSAGLGTAFTPKLHRVVPKEGQLVLFPSHFWHHTIPFESAETRISIAFDLVPISD
ncbi:MAG: tetratricopeptide repeat protein [Pseudomonadota bacterium]